MVALALLSGVIGSSIRADEANATDDRLCSGCARLSIERIGLDVVAEPGGQDVIDGFGAVAIYSPFTDAPVGSSGTVWLAGHRTSHGAVFRSVPELSAGDSITLRSASGTYHFTVDRRFLLDESDPFRDIDIDDRSRPRVIIQTSHPERHLRYIVEAFMDTSATTERQPATPAPSQDASVDATPPPGARFALVAGPSRHVRAQYRWRGRWS